MVDRLRVLVDTNVILDVLQVRQPFYEDSANVVDAVARQQVAGLLAAHTITNLFYIMSRFQNRATTAATLTHLLSTFNVGMIDDTVIRQALGWGWHDFEDAVQMATAVHENIDYIVTRNVKDFETQPVPVLLPSGLLAILSQQRK
ncbi:MAG: PIN domain-containing protein [Chloroflexi bacterium]|nr:PIN domain-containing protein [Chloroflexota bacterium]